MSRQFSFIPLPFARFGGPLFNTPEPDEVNVGGDAGGEPAEPVATPAPAIREDQVVVSRAEFDRYKRHSEQYNGARPVLEQLQGYGIKGADDLKRWDSVLRGISNPESFRDAIHGQQKQQPAEPLTEQKLIELLDRREGEKAYKEALNQHLASEKAMYGKIDDLAEALTGKLFDGESGDAAKKLIRKAVKAEIDERYYAEDRTYQDGPLASRRIPRPLGEDELAGIVDGVVKELGLSEGQRLMRIGKATGGGSPPRATPATGHNTPAQAPKPGSRSREDILNEVMSKYASADS